MSERERLTRLSDSSYTSDETDITSITNCRNSNTRTSQDFAYTPSDTPSYHSSLSLTSRSSEDSHSVFDRLKRIFDVAKGHVENGRKIFETQATEEKELFGDRSYLMAKNEINPTDGSHVFSRHNREGNSTEEEDKAIRRHIDEKQKNNGWYANPCPKTVSQKQKRTSVHNCCLFKQSANQGTDYTCKNESSSEAKSLFDENQSQIDSEKNEAISRTVDTGLQIVQNTDKEIKEKLENCFDRNTKDLKVRDTIKMFRVDEFEFLKLHSNYNNLKKLFAALTVVNIILIICVVSVLPVILVTFKLSYDLEGKSEDDIRKIISQELLSFEEKKKSSTVSCVSCSSLDQTLIEVFAKSNDQRCCVEDIFDVILFLNKLSKQRREECNSRLTNLEGEQKNIQIDIADIKMAILNESGIDGNKSWPKHPGIQKNNRLINLLLTHRRSAIHLKGAVKNGELKWTTDMLEGKLSYADNGISVQNGGMYYVYSVIRYKNDSCSSNKKIGYEVKRKTGIGAAVSVASVHMYCSSGESYNQDLIIQRVFKVSVGQKSKVFIDIGELRNSLVAEDNIHTFGVFEL